MGMDPLSQNDDWELVITVEGPVKKQGFRDFKKALHDFIDACENINSGFQDNSNPPKQLKLKVREVRGGVRRKA
jgi:hypothetical protein